MTGYLEPTILKAYMDVQLGKTVDWALNGSLNVKKEVPREPRAFKHQTKGRFDNVAA